MAWHKKKNCRLLLGKPWRTHITWKKIDICLTVPDSPPLFLSVNISAMVSSPQPQHHIPWSSWTAAWQKKNCHLLLGKPWRTHITWKEITVPDSPPLFLSVNISAMVSSPQPQHHIPQSSWTAESDGPQPNLTGRRIDGGFPSPGSSFNSLLLELTSHVWQRSTESGISFPFSSFGYNSSPGSIRSHFRHVQNNFSTFSKASRHPGLNLHEVGLQLSRY